MTVLPKYVTRTFIYFRNTSPVIYFSSKTIIQWQVRITLMPVYVFSWYIESIEVQARMAAFYKYTSGTVIYFRTKQLSIALSPI